MAASKVYDFLYADHEKVASILSQIEEDGALKETAVRAQKGKDHKTGFSAKVGGLGGEIGTNRGHQYEVRQTYDPLWRNSRKLIEYIGRTSQKPELLIGQMCVMEGDLIAFDQSVLSKLMAATSMRDFIASGIKEDDDQKKSAQKKIRDKMKEAEVIQKYIETLGLSIQFVLCTLQTGFWFNINRDYLYLHETDIPLKYPITISGKWQILGIIDALPNDQFSLDHLYDAGASPHIPNMITHLAQLIWGTSVSFGRPLASYGLKPLAIFREIVLPAFKSS
ncbi:DUF6414 family protein [Sphingobium chungbukense]|uniref:Uncharacterized protein n=1 Tax=Sphingobium chungbukense TaxID=56193 RepID=A0A0M3AQE1_9SPHN|nr:hypothetical protein [Sphingobium chungbukense]KKW92417.1 hypothetical protein YP76_10955 [Sphingobium chungbukense]